MSEIRQVNSMSNKCLLLMYLYLLINQYDYHDNDYFLFGIKYCFYLLEFDIDLSANCSVVAII